MSTSMPGRGRFPAAEGATAAVPKRSVEQFRVHVIERIPDAARAKLQSVNPAETVAGNRAPAERGPYEIVSLGSDGQEGGMGTAADISSDGADAKRP